MHPDGWPSEWLRAVLWLCALQVICDQDEAYGYGIAAALRDRGLGVVGGGTLYPVLRRLESDGLVVSEWREGLAGPGRKFYRPTSEGRRRLAEVGAEWGGFVEVTGAMLRAGGAGR